MSIADFDDEEVAGEEEEEEALNEADELEAEEDDSADFLGLGFCGPSFGCWSFWGPSLG